MGRAHRVHVDSCPLFGKGPGGSRVVEVNVGEQHVPDVDRIEAHAPDFPLQAVVGGVGATLYQYRAIGGFYQVGGNGLRDTEEVEVEGMDP